MVECREAAGPGAAELVSPRPTGTCTGFFPSAESGS